MYFIFDCSISPWRFCIEVVFISLIVAYQTQKYKVFFKSDHCTTVPTTVPWLVAVSQQFGLVSNRSTVAAQTSAGRPISLYEGERSKDEVPSDPLPQAVGEVNPRAHAQTGHISCLPSHRGYCAVGSCDWRRPSPPSRPRAFTRHSGHNLITELFPTGI